MAIFQNSMVTELEAQVKQLIAERDDLQDKLGKMQYENQRLNERIAVYAKNLEEHEKRLAAINIHNARDAGRKPVTTPEDVTAIIELRGQGDGITKIFKAFNGQFSKSTIYRIIKKSASQN